MTQQFQEGQDVEVFAAKPSYYGKHYTEEHFAKWRKAKIVARASDAPITRTRQWAVQFHDGSRAVIDAEHIRTVETLEQQMDRFYTKYPELFD